MIPSYHTFRGKCMMLTPGPKTPPGGSWKESGRRVADLHPRPRKGTDPKPSTPQPKPAVRPMFGRKHLVGIGFRSTLMFLPFQGDE